MEETTKPTWKPQDFGFLPQENNPNVYHRFPYDLRHRGDNVWLCRRKQRKGDMTVWMTKFFYTILPTDRTFAELLLEKRIDKV